MDLVHESDVEGAAARCNRERIRRAGVHTVNLIGGPGCGKTSLIEATMRRLLLKRRVGAIVADAFSRCDADRLSALATQVLHVDPREGSMLRASHVKAALARMNVSALDLLVIENVSSLVGPARIDLGEDAKVAMFSVAAGHDKAARHPDLVRAADVVILNKIDLLADASFDLTAFRTSVVNLKPTAQVIELSTLTGDGMGQWTEWLLNRSVSRPAAASS
jgi:hydrogenase nickel incorporation protein HypB